METKREFRQYVKFCVSALTAEQKQTKSGVIQHYVLSCDQFRQAKEIFVYLSTDDEVATSEIIEAALSQNKTVYIPKIVDGEMEMSLLEVGQALKENVYNILESESPKLFNKRVDLAIIPVVGVDNGFNRLGHGKGYYDRYLAKFDCFKMALAFSEQIVEACLPADSFDVKMDCIVSENGIRRNAI